LSEQNEKNGTGKLKRNSVTVWSTAIATVLTATTGLALGLVNRCSPEEPTAKAIHRATDKVAKELSGDIFEIRKECSQEIEKAQQEMMKRVTSLVTSQVSRVEDMTTWFLAGQMSVTKRAASTPQSRESRKLLEKLVKSHKPAPPPPKAKRRCGSGYYYSFVKGSCVSQKKAIRKLPSIKKLQTQQQFQDE